MDKYVIVITGHKHEINENSTKNFDVSTMMFEFENKEQFEECMQSFFNHVPESNIKYVKTSPMLDLKIKN